MIAFLAVTLERDASEATTKAKERAEDIGEIRHLVSSLVDPLYPYIQNKSIWRFLGDFRRIDPKRIEADYENAEGSKFRVAIESDYEWLEIFLSDSHHLIISSKNVVRVGTETDKTRGRGNHRATSEEIGEYKALLGKLIEKQVPFRKRY